MNTMGRTADTLSRALPALLTAVVASIVLGIVGMHALSTHGVSGMGTGSLDHSTMTGPMTVADGVTHSGMSTGPVISPAAGKHAGTSSTAPEGDGGHSLGSMVMLCFAMLAATAGALLLLLLGLRYKPRVWDALRAPTTVARWVTARLGTGPPYVWQFSVIRC
ncbi:hypothetical protein J2X46_002357 [Nocardioides sp. BE266]|uniref:hypothetical protein n=1 Tax=Nocardioides sp. BE266 TaxID=2817725 RepID=UPI002861AD59|nr:hypothetical protein [Nocardioides sp. BE266]MDR7253372.1 hypothetical protein [Nocardioides sp. BE266]